ncbi:hypothetical protein VTL71DRAFT_891 [Oculimacula yallundae]|uniref:Uncharacterized protein n=1 Tax=Oculimacula yallundae TaxID=86028 RepID=A0ABR4D1B4_9HELO
MTRFRRDKDKYVLQNRRTEEDIREERGRGEEQLTSPSRGVLHVLIPSVQRSTSKKEWATRLGQDSEGGMDPEKTKEKFNKPFGSYCPTNHRTSFIAPAGPAEQRPRPRSHLI